VSRGKWGSLIPSDFRSAKQRKERIGKELDALFALGPKILPLVVESLTDPHNFLALQLYDTLQASPKSIVQFDPEDERILAGQQGRTQEVANVYITTGTNVGTCRYGDYVTIRQAPSQGSILETCSPLLGMVSTLPHLPRQARSQIFAMCYLAGLPAKDN
jgi:hypothetical protein